MRTFCQKLLIVGGVLLFWGSVQIHAQNRPMTTRPPVMKSIFWNTVFGSAWGALMGTAVAVNGNVSFRESLVVGTTIGGVMGYGFGIFLVVRGITFDPATLPVPPIGPVGVAPPLSSPHGVQNEIVLFSTEGQSATRPSHQKWQTTIFQMQF